MDPEPIQPKFDVNQENSSEFLRRIGAISLANDIDRLGIAVRVAEIEAIRNHYTTALDIQQLKEDRLVEDVKALNADLMQHSINYNNVVAGLGYAGFVALLSLVSSLVFPKDFMAIVLLLGLSLIVFVVWTAFHGYLIVRSVQRTAPLFLIPEGEYDRRVMIEKFNTATQVREAEFSAMQRFWPPAFIFSLITGVVAATILFSSLVLKIFGANNGVINSIMKLIGYSHDKLV